MKRKKYTDRRYRDAGALLVELGFLVSGDRKQKAPAKMRLDDIRWAGEQVEPRFLAVLPAAILAYPERFSGRVEEWPELSDVLLRLQRGERSGPSLGPIPFAELQRWAKLPLRDRRRKPPAVRKLMRSFRLRPDVVRALAELAKNQRESEAAVIERLVDEAARETISD